MGTTGTCGGARRGDLTVRLRGETAGDLVLAVQTRPVSWAVEIVPSEHGGLFVAKQVARLQGLGYRALDVPDADWAWRTTVLPSDAASHSTVP